MRPTYMLAVVLFAIAPGAMAQDPALARSLAATCAGCHGTDGRSVSPVIAPLAGLPKEFIVAQMKLFRDGKRPATVMHQLAKGYTDVQIDLLAGFLAAQPRN